MLLAMSLAAPAWAAAELQVYPVRFALGADNPVGILTVINRGAADTLQQLGLFAWTQDGDRDTLAPTRDVLANPGIFTLKAGDQQIARLGLRVPPLAVERSYRLILQEVPRQQAGGGLATLLRMSIPIFVPPAAPQMALAWSARPAAGGIEIVARNGGNVHVQLRELRLTTGGAPLASRLLNVYVLPGAVRTLPLAMPHPPAPGTTLRLHAETDQGPIDATLTADAAGGHDPR